MRGIIALAITACSLLAMALLLLGWGIWQRRKKYVFGVGISLLLSALVASWAGWRVLHKTYASVTGALRPRSGQEIYAALLGPPLANCVQVLNYQDQTVPRIDYAIWLHYRTCPDELRRVLTRHSFAQGQLVSTSGIASVPYGEVISWFKPAAIGDTVVVYEYTSANGRNTQTLWVSPDSTNVFLRDIAD